jgi:hypothetical protein
VWTITSSCYRTKALCSGLLRALSYYNSHQLYSFMFQWLLWVRRNMATAVPLRWQKTTVSSNIWSCIPSGRTKNTISVFEENDTTSIIFGMSVYLSAWQTKRVCYEMAHFDEAGYRFTRINSFKLISFPATSFFSIANRRVSTRKPRRGCQPSTSYSEYSVFESWPLNQILFVMGFHNHFHVCETEIMNMGKPVIYGFMR